MEFETVILTVQGVDFDVAAVLLMGITAWGMACVALFAGLAFASTKTYQRLTMGAFATVCGLMLAPLAFTIGRDLLAAFA